MAGLGLQIVELQDLKTPLYVVKSRKRVKWMMNLVAGSVMALQRRIEGLLFETLAFEALLIDHP